MERQNQNPNWTAQFTSLPDGWDTDPAIFEQVIQEHVFSCEGANCPIRGKALVKGEGMLKFVKVTGTKAVMETNGITPKRDPDGDPLFERRDLKRKILCSHHLRFEEQIKTEAMKSLPEEFRKRGDKMEVQTSTLFQNLSWVRELTKKAKRPERVAKFFLSLTEGADLQSGIMLDCIQPFTKDDKKPHNFLIRGGEVLGIIPWDDVAIYNGVRHQNKNAFVDGNLFLYSDSTLAWVEERLVEWRKSADEKSATRMAREAEAAERLATVQTRKQEELASVKNAAAEILAFFVGATPPTEPTTDGDGRNERRKEPRGNGRKDRADGAPKRKSSPPPAARQIDEQLVEGGRVTPLSDGTPDVIVDDQAGSSKPTSAVALGDRPEISEKLEAVRAQLTK